MKADVKVTWNASAVEKIKEDTLRGLVAMGFAVANQARDRAPYRTGALSNSIHVAEDGKKVYVIAGGRGVNYAAYQEFGTRFFEGRHYLQKSLDNILAGDWSKYFKI